MNKKLEGENLSKKRKKSQKNLKKSAKNAKLHQKTNFVAKVLYSNPYAFAVAALTFVLVAFGALMVYSASYYSAEKYYGNEYFFLFKQLLGIALGVVLMVFFAMFDYHRLKKLRFWILLGALVLLLLVFVPGLGQERYGARRWISLFGVSIQPSEIAKFAVVIFLASNLSQNYQKVKTLRGLIAPLAVVGSVCVLVMLEPSMSVTMCIGVVSALMFVAGGISKKHTLMFSVPVVAAVPALILLEPYRLRRLMAFLDPWASPQGEGFQLIQSLYSLGSGGWFGVGLFNSRQKLLFLPFAESDFIISIIGEEVGFVGLTALLFVFALLVVFLLKIALSAPDRFGALLVAGIAFVIAVQTLLNVAVVTGSIPPTGLPLPFISAGGTSVSVFMAGIGIAINVALRGRRRRDG